jgi:putative transposon-encoded protein
MVIVQMGKAKPKLKIDTVFEWVGYDTEFGNSAKISVRVDGLGSE